MKKKTVQRTSLARTLKDLTVIFEANRIHSQNTLHKPIRKSSFRNNSFANMPEGHLSSSELVSIREEDWHNPHKALCSSEKVVAWIEVILTKVDLPNLPIKQSLSWVADLNEPQPPIFGVRLAAQYKQQHFVVTADKKQPLQDHILQKNATNRSLSHKQHHFHTVSPSINLIPLCNDDGHKDNRQIERLRLRRQVMESSNTAYFKRTVVQIEEVKKTHVKETDFTFGYLAERINFNKRKTRKTFSVEPIFICKRQNLENISRKSQVLPQVILPTARRQSNRLFEIDGILDPKQYYNWQQQFKKSLDCAVTRLKLTPKTQHPSFQDPPSSMTRLQSRRPQF